MCGRNSRYGLGEGDRGRATWVTVRQSEQTKHFHLATVRLHYEIIQRWHLLHLGYQSYISQSLSCLKISSNNIEARQYCAEQAYTTFAVAAQVKKSQILINKYHVLVAAVYRSETSYTDPHFLIKLAFSERNNVQSSLRALQRGNFRQLFFGENAFNQCVQVTLWQQQKVPTHIHMEAQRHIIISRKICINRSSPLGSRPKEEHSVSWRLLLIARLFNRLRRK